jgi:hypothetical protein
MMVSFELAGVMAAVLTMTEFDIAALKRAYEGSESAVAV